MVIWSDFFVFFYKNKKSISWVVGIHLIGVIMDFHHLHQTLGFFSSYCCLFLAKGFPLWFKWHKSKRIPHLSKHQILTLCVGVVDLALHSCHMFD